MAVITWRNVNTPNFGGSLAALNRASQNLTQNIQGLGDQATQYGNQVRDADTQNFLNQIQGINDLNQYNTQSAAILDQARQQGTNVDFSKILGASQSRDDTLRQESTDLFNYQETQRKQAEAPQVAAINNLIAAGQFDEANKAIAGSNIQDTSQLLKGVKAAQRSELEQNRADVDYARREDAYQDDQVLNRAITEMTTTREANIAESRRQQQEDFAVGFNGVSFDGSGAIQFADSVSAEDRKTIQKEYDEFATTLPTIKSDKEQLADLTKIIKDRSIDAKVGLDAKDTLKVYQAKRKSLTPEQEARVGSTLQSIDTQEAAELQTIDQALEEVVADNPVDLVTTPEREKVKPSAAAAQARKDFADFDNLDAAEKKDITDKLGSYADKIYTGPDGKKLKYPGWVIKEAYDRVGLASIFEEGLINDVVAFTQFENALDSVMAGHVQAQKNKDIVSNERAKAAADKLKASTKYNTSRTNALSNAKASASIYDINRNPSQLLSEQLARARNR